ncbi:MAG: tryptophan--tRNA ligase [Gammaproteobacteria bacterium]|nr:tryptophan--tRNA ligase [Gammaproteobacteria bacterium]
MEKRVLTGITTSGVPHLGNLAGAILPAIEASRHQFTSSFLFLADYHSLIKSQDPAMTHNSSFEIAASWLACGLDPNKVTFYRQSDIPEIMELAWILSCVTAKGLMNRAHAYKAATAINKEKEVPDLDKGVLMGLFNYPILMAADILAFNADQVPVGGDQKQHLEMARDIAARFNYLYGEVFKLPEAVINSETGVLPGIDGQKMSKSYNNTIPIFLNKESLLKMIKKIKTNSLEPGIPKDSNNCTIFKLYKAFASEGQIQDLEVRYQKGIGWGEAKDILYSELESKIEPIRERYELIRHDKRHLEHILIEGAVKAREVSSKIISDVREAVGIKGFC